MNDTHALEIPRPGSPLEAAVRYFGSPAALAKALGYSSANSIYNWRKGSPIPARSALAIEALTEGQITAKDLLDYTQ